MKNIFALLSPLEGHNHCKVNFKINETEVNADLGDLTVEDNVENFTPKYTSAVVPISNILDYVESHDDNI